MIGITLYLMKVASQDRLKSNTKKINIPQVDFREKTLFKI